MDFLPTNMTVCTLRAEPDLNKSSSGDEIPERDVTYMFTYLSLNYE